MFNKLFQNTDIKKIVVDFKNNEVTFDEKYKLKFENFWGSINLQDKLEDLIRVNPFIKYDVSYQDFIESSIKTLKDKDEYCIFDLDIIPFDLIEKHNITFTNGPTFLYYINPTDLSTREEGVNKTKHYDTFQDMLDDLKNYKSIYRYSRTGLESYSLRGFRMEDHNIKLANYMRREAENT